MKPKILTGVVLVILLSLVSTVTFFTPALAFWAPLTREIELKVDVFTGDYTDWSTYGAAPFLDTVGDGNYVETSDYCSRMGLFSFEDLTLNPDEVVIWVEFEVYAKAESADIDGDVYLFTSETEWYWAGSIEAEADWGWYFTEYDVTWALYNETTINSAQFLIHYWTPDKSSGPKMTIDAAHLMVTVGYAVPEGEKPRVLRVPDMYPTIQGAIDAAMSEDTIIVSEGVYAEGQINVNKPLTIIADHGEVIVDGLQEHATFNVSSDNVTIRGFTVVNASYAGIVLYFWPWSLSTSHCRIEGNKISNNGAGIIARGNYNVIRKNKITNHNHSGVAISGDHNIVEKNEIANNWGGSGVGISGSHNIVKRNLIANNKWGVSASGRLSTINRNMIVNNKLIGIGLGTSFGNVVEGNVIAENGWAGIYVAVVPASTSSTQQFSGYSNLIVRNKVINNNRTGVGLGWGASSNVVRKNEIVGNMDGILMVGRAMHNLIEQNEIYGNKRHGILVTYVSKKYYCPSLNNIQKNIIIKNHDGILLEKSDRNIIEENTVIKNTRYGIAITQESNYNTINKNRALHNHEFDLYWGGTGTDNIWEHNIYKTKSW